MQESDHSIVRAVLGLESLGLTVRTVESYRASAVVTSKYRGLAAI
jgi:hypothetical protein